MLVGFNLSVQVRHVPCRSDACQCIVCDVHLSLLPQRVSDKKSELKALDRKVRPMEDMFAKFRSWLAESKAGLSAFSPAPSLAEEAERKKALRQAQVCMWIWDTGQTCMGMHACVKVVSRQPENLHFDQSQFQK